MGGMIVQEYALAYPEDLQSVIMACTYAAPGPFCSRMFAMWADAAPVLGIPFVMRDVTLWAFTTGFFSDRPEELAEFETAMRYMDQPVPAYLAELAVIQQHDSTERLAGITTPTLVLAGEQDILIPVSLSRELHTGIPARSGRPSRAATPACGSTPPPSTAPLPISSAATERVTMSMNTGPVGDADSFAGTGTATAPRPPGPRCHAARSGCSAC